MEKYISVKFETTNKTYTFKTTDETIVSGDYVVVETQRGMELATVVGDPFDKPNIEMEIKPIIRKATQQDKADFEKNKADAIEAKQKNDKLEFTNQLSIGMPLDLSKISYGATEKNSITAGISFKGASKLNYSPMENLNLTANVGAFYTHTPHFDHSGINAEIGANYKTNKGNNLFATIGVEQEREHLSMNLFDETLKNEAEISTSIGYERKKVTFGGSISYNTGTKQASGSISAKIKR